MSKSAHFDVIVAGSEGQICMTEIFTTEAPQRIAREENENEAQLVPGQFMHFPRIAAGAPDDVDLNTCVSVVTSLRKEFASRFIGFRPMALGFMMFTFPFDFLVDEAPAPMQMESMEL